MDLNATVSGLAELLRSEEVKSYIDENYEGTVIPAE